MRKFKGQNVLNHRATLNVPLIVCLSILLLAGLALLFAYGLQNAHQTVATTTINGYEVKLVYKVSWDNYCLAPKLQIISLQNHSKTVFQSKSYEGPCGHNHPQSFWMRTGDFNHDGHTDFSVLSGYGGSDKLEYIQFIYNPTTMPFVRQ